MSSKMKQIAQINLTDNPSMWQVKKVFHVKGLMYSSVCRQAWQPFYLLQRVSKEKASVSLTSTVFHRSKIFTSYNFPLDLSSPTTESIDIFNSLLSTGFPNVSHFFFYMKPQWAGFPPECQNSGLLLHSSMTLLIKGNQLHLEFPWQKTEDMRLLEWQQRS